MKNRDKIIRSFYFVFAITALLGIFFQFVDTREFLFVLAVFLLVRGVLILLGIVVLMVLLFFVFMKKIHWLDLMKVMIVYVMMFIIVNFLPWSGWYTSIRYDLTPNDLKEVVKMIETGEGNVVFDDECEGKGRCYNGTLILTDGDMIAFVTIPGVVDNWGGIVYDPTGLIQRGLDEGYGYEVWDRERFSDLKHIFMGDLVGCVKLEEDWFECSFT